MNDVDLKSKRILKKRNVFRISLVVILLVLTSFLLFIFLILAKVISFDSPSYFVVLNLKEQQISVNDTPMNIFNVYVGETNIPVKYSLIDSENKEIVSKTLPEVGSPKLSLFVNSEKQYCFFSAEVTSFYYDTEMVENTIGQYVILSDQPSSSIEVTFDNANNYYIFPGRYSSKDLPQTLVDKKLIGIYPISCEKINESSERIETVMFYKHFNPAEQQEYYYSKIAPLKEELSGI
jgi:hypothetical protein